ncbi:MAG TPA: M1 family aminopeptidase [Candidatus Acidoferrales bacterium]|nr:M1 family aminopeptidase [Candidatus Acidoferrales bacterium]
MRRLCRAATPVLFLLATPLLLLMAAPLQAQDAAGVWEGLGRPAGDPAHVAAVENVSLQRDAIKITLISGQIQFAQPLAGRPFGAAFRGRGRVEVAPPNKMEAQQLQLLCGQNTLDLEFAEGAFFFNDQTFNDVAKQVHWSESGGGPAELMKARMDEQEINGTQIKPRLLRSLLSKDPAANRIFFADLKTKDKGWIEFTFDADQIEEVSVRRWRDWGRGRGLDTWMAFPAGGRSPFEADQAPGVKDSYTTPSYKMDVSITTAAELTATTQAVVEEHVTGDQVLLFDFDSNLRMDSVKDERGAALVFFQARERKDSRSSTGDYLAVVLPEPAEKGRTKTLEFHYSGKRVVNKVGAGNYFCESFGWYPARESAWHERHLFEMTFHIPKQFALTATGVKASEEVQGSVSTSVWKNEVPLVVAGFGFGDFKVVTEKAGNVDIEVYAARNPDDIFASIGAQTSMGGLDVFTPSAMAKVMGAEVANMVKAFDVYFGPFPYTRLSATNIPYSYGQGWPMLLYLSALSFLDSTQRNALGFSASGQVMVTDFFRAHETSHQWWGHKVSWKTYHDQWMSEGFAQFSGNLYVQLRRNMDDYLNQIKLDRQSLFSEDPHGRRYESLGPVWMGWRTSSSDSPGAYSVIIYRKGGLVLNTLRWMLRDQTSQDPDARFIGMMREFTQIYANKAASTEDFKAVAEKYMTSAMDIDGNHKLNWFFRQYVYGTGIPQYKLKYDLSNGDPGKIKISLTVTRVNDLGPDWVDIVPLYAETEKKTVRLGWLTVRGKELTTEFQIPTRISGLVLNANYDALIEVK